MSYEFASVTLNLVPDPIATVNGYAINAQRIQSVELDGLAVVHQEPQPLVHPPYTFTLPRATAEPLQFYYATHCGENIPPHIDEMEGNSGIYAGAIAARGPWIAADGFDFNLNGANGVHVHPSEVTQLSSMDNLLQAGEVYGVSTDLQPNPDELRFPLLLVGLGKAGIHTSVLRQGHTPHIGSTRSLLRAMQAQALYHIPKKPQVVGTNDWKIHVAQGENGLRKVAAFETRQTERALTRRLYYETHNLKPGY